MKQTGRLLIALVLPPLFALVDQPAFGFRDDTVRDQQGHALVHANAFLTFGTPFKTKIPSTRKPVVQQNTDGLSFYMNKTYKHTGNIFFFKRTAADFSFTTFAMASFNSIGKTSHIYASFAAIPWANWGYGIIIPSSGYTQAGIGLLDTIPVNQGEIFAAKGQDIDNSRYNAIIKINEINNAGMGIEYWRAECNCGTFPGLPVDD